jgi:hypothetical protein
MPTTHEESRLRGTAGGCAELKAMVTNAPAALSHPYAPRPISIRRNRPWRDPAAIALHELAGPAVGIDERLLRSHRPSVGGRDSVACREHNLIR